jgi:hypothetical protein
VALSGSTADLCEQFVLSRSLDTPDGFETEHLASWRLAHHPTLPVITIRGAGQRAGEPDRLGWLLGYPVTSDGVLLRSGSSVTARDDDPLTFVESLGGRFLAVFVDGANPAIYPDAGGTYSSVFCGSLEVAASTPGLIPYDDTTLDRQRLVEQLGIPWNNSMYPLGLTPRHNVGRLLPNHHLDLGTWTMVRHGPRWRARGAVSVEDSVSRFAAIVRRNVAAIADVYPCYVQLTAGSDSRALVACARELRSQIATYTLRIPDLNGMTDADVAARISAHVGLSHQSVPIIDPDPADLDLWVYRTSCSVGEPRGWQATTTLRSLDRSRVHLGGNIGDLSRTYYWDVVVDAETPVTIDQLAGRALAFGMGQLDAGQQQAAESTVVREEIERWRDASTAPDSYALMDLLYVENRVGCWAGIWPYAQYYGPGFSFFPMSHREAIDLMMFLPETVRRRGDFNRMVIRQEWPELLELPFNDPSRSVRAAHLPRRVARGVARRSRRLAGRIGRGSPGTAS